MNRIAKFEKVSLEQYKKDVSGSSFAVEEVYKKLTLPIRATKNSAGYDFFLPAYISLAPGETEKIPTGIRVKIDEGWVLKCYPRSGLGFKYKLQLDNTVGIIDSDYYNAKNEGHIFLKITNEGNKDVIIKQGEAFAQGIFVEYGITVDDEADGVREGGFGSTSKG